MTLNKKWVRGEGKKKSWNGGKYLEIRAPFSLFQEFQLFRTRFEKSVEREKRKKVSNLRTRKKEAEKVWWKN